MTGPALLAIWLLLAGAAARYDVALSLDETTHTLAGREQVTYRNPGPDTLDAIWLHAFPNAFAGRTTAFGRELEAQGSFAFSLAPASARGALQINVVRAAGRTIAHRLHETELELRLERPLLPGDSIQIELDFTTRLPKMVGELGYRGREYLLAHCFPQVAARSGGQWQTEGYHVLCYAASEYADYDVTITLPADLAVAGTGVVAETAESPLPYPAWLRMPPTARSVAAGALRTLRFRADNVADFALVAGPRYTLLSDSSSGTAVRVFCRYPVSADWLNALDQTRAITSAYAAWFGPCPHQNIAIVQANGTAAGDVAYPGLVVMATRPIPGTRLFEQALAQQIARQWFPGGDDITQHWLSLGPATLAEMRYMEDRYGATNLVYDPTLGWLLKGLGSEYYHRASHYVAASNDLLRYDRLACRDPLGYSAAQSSRPGLLLREYEAELGPERFDRLAQAYVRASAGRQPDAALFDSIFPGFTARLATIDMADTFMPARLWARRATIRPIIALPDFNSYQLFYGPWLWLDNYHGFQLQGWLHGRQFVDAGPLRGRHMWMLSETYSTKLHDWHTSFSYNSPLGFLSRRLRLQVGLDYSLVEAGARANLIQEFGPALRLPKFVVDFGYRYLDLYDLKFRDRRAWDSAGFSDLRLRMSHTYEARNWFGSQRAYVARGLKMLGGDYNYWKFSIEQTHTFRWRLGSGITARVFAGTVQGNIPSQEQYYLSGGLTATTGEPVSWGYVGWTSAQVNWHYDGDVNLRGFAGEYHHGRYAWGLNLYAAPVRLVQPFFDIGNVSDDPAELARPRMDAGVRIRLGPVYADFPFWRYHIGEPDIQQFAFRWMLGLKVSEITTGH